MPNKALKSIRANVLAGFFLSIPVVATILVFNFLFKLATDWFPTGFFPPWVLKWNKYPLRFLILLALLAALYLVGLLTRNILGRRLYQLGDRIIARIPIVKSVYLSIRKFSESLVGGKKDIFTQVALVEFPGKGLYSIGFVTAVLPESVAVKVADCEGQAAKDCVAVFVPTIPNPTTGFLLLAPKSKIVLLDIPVSDAITYVVSFGTVAPGKVMGQPAATLLDRLESWRSEQAAGTP